MGKKTYECLLCGEDLQENTKGKLTNPNTGEELTIYFCEDCEQSFVLKDKKLMIVPYRDDMNPIKHECVICGTIEHFDQNVCFVFNGSARYSVFCKDCAIEFYRNWLRTEKGTNIESVTKDNVEEISQLHETVCMNKLLQNPKYIEHLQNDPAIKELKKKFDDLDKSEEGKARHSSQA